MPKLSRGRFVGLLMSLLGITQWPSGSRAGETTWVKFSTRSCEVCSAISPAVTQEWLTVTESFRSIVRTLGPADERAMNRLSVVIFRDNRAFQKIFPDRENNYRQDVIWTSSCRSFELGGRTVLGINDEDREMARDSFLQRTGTWTAQMFARPLPHWLVTGLGECCAQAYVRSDRVEFGDRSKVDANQLGRQPPESVGKFMANHLVETMRGGTISSRFFADAWLLVHFLLWGEGGAHRPALVRYINAWQVGRPHAEAVAAAFPEGLADLQRRLERYVKQGRYRGESVPLPPARLAAGIKSSPLGPGELELFMGYMAVAAQRPAEAEISFVQAAAAMPETAAYYEAECFLALSRRDQDVTGTMAAKAVAAGSTWPEAHLYAARITAHDLLGTENVIDQTSPVIAREVATALGKLIDLSPDYSGYEMFALIVGSLGEVTEQDARILADGSRMFPDKVAMALGQAAYELKSGQLAAAHASLDRLRAEREDRPSFFQPYFGRIEARLLAVEGLAKAWDSYRDGKDEQARQELGKAGRSALTSAEYASREELSELLKPLEEIRHALADQDFKAAAYYITEAGRDNPPEKIKARLAEWSAEVAAQKRSSK